MRHQKQNFILLLLILGTVLFLTGLTNYARYHSFTEFGYGYFSTLAAHNGWKGLIGLLVSPGAGLIFYFPLAILLPLGAKYMYKENKSLFYLCLYIIVANWIYFGTLSFGFEPASWSGGVAWGPRYLLPVVPFMLIILGSIFQNIKKRILLKSIVLGLCIGRVLCEFEWGPYLVSIRAHVWVDIRKASIISKLHGHHDLVTFLFTYCTPHKGPIN